MSKLVSAPSDVCGGKAAVLLELQAAGFRVPEFCISPTDLAAVVSRLDVPLAVRSSATVEDGRAASFRGSSAVPSISTLKRTSRQLSTNAESQCSAQCR